MTADLLVEYESAWGSVRKHDGLTPITMEGDEGETTIRCEVESYRVAVELAVPTTEQAVLKCVIS